MQLTNVISKLCLWTSRVYIYITSMSEVAMVSGCSLHHFNPSWIHVSLLKKRTFTQVLSQRIHRKSTRKRPSWMAESDLVYIAVQCRNSDGRHGTYRPRYPIFGYHESVRQSNWASVFALVPRSALDVEGWSICTSQERHLRRWENSFGYIWLAIRRAISMWLTRFQVATERLQELVRNKWTCWKQI